MVDPSPLIGEGFDKLIGRTSVASRGIIPHHMLWSRETPFPHGTERWDYDARRATVQTIGELHIGQMSASVVDAVSTV